MNYQEIMSWLEERPQLAFDKGVARVQWLLDQLGNPEKRLATIHVVGTNGKGSTVAYLEAMFQEAGYRVGRFTSPSIIDFREQIVYQGQMISEADLLALMTKLQPLIARLPKETDLQEASDFEIIVVAMLVYFADYVQPDLVLVEAGMGGLLDATNVLHPLAVIITSIGLDHQAFLGQTHAEIAGHKVGVLKSGVPLVYATEQPEVATVFEQTAKTLGSPTYRLGRDMVLENSRAGWQMQTSQGSLRDVQLLMTGQYQAQNAALAVTTAFLLAEEFPKLTPEIMQAGLAKTFWPGRQELLGPNLLIDGAHNDESIAALCQTLRTEYADKEITILFAAIATKPVETMLSQLAVVGQVIVTSFDDPRALALENYPTNYPSIASFEDWLAGVDPTRTDTLYVVTGSLYFIDPVRKYILSQKK
ncbi:TPA: folylpolyglutamate synthase/dihydrofolate synthase family protein [Streptococcus suis]